VKVTTATTWNVLLDLASEGGLEAHVLLTSTGLGTLGFEVWPGMDATAAALEAAQIVTHLFNEGGQNADEIFQHCACMGAVYQEFIGGHLNYRGPFMVAVKELHGTGVTRQ
jgi:hypothetical protein